MDAGGYRVVFDVTQTAPAWWFPAFGLIFVIVGAVQWRFRQRGSLRRAVFAGFFLAFSVLWTIGAGVGVFSQHFRAQRMLENGEAQLVEGRVEDFAFTGKDERFVVGGVRFDYSDYRINAGFNNTSGRGGPMRAGLMARIHYIRAREQALILKLEIKEPDAAR